MSRDVIALLPETPTRKITPDEYHQVCAMLDFLAAIFVETGVVELRISKQNREIFWDTEGGAQVRPEALAAWCAAVERHYWQRIEVHARKVAGGAD